MEESKEDIFRRAQLAVLDEVRFALPPRGKGIMVPVDYVFEILEELSINIRNS